jgi:hypothetical protein
MAADNRLVTTAEPPQLPRSRRRKARYHHNGEPPERLRKSLPGIYMVNALRSSYYDIA